MLHFNTVNVLLKDSLDFIMQAEIFNDFRLVGGTSLSLQLGHRESVDIDVFTDAPYGTIDFAAIDRFLQQNFAYVHHTRTLPAMGKSYLIGSAADHAVKLDVFYTEAFIQPPLLNNHIRLATIDEIVAMKIDVVQRTGRKKDFWDLHEIMDDYSLDQMLALHKKRYPYTHNANLIIKNLTDFTSADGDFDPICLRGKFWELIKYDLTAAFGDAKL
ncbi:nucleotidyl transferase AbiEii/AbiGii toxin family protein [Flavobacterium dauae]|uniref:nucleotidyl transferase AbiEii/AbiGii toxin family protein n=1 Tax=Flavobacterium dauae TaxID=1563479 RepID=UPI00101B2FB9|nr:nucleotidyl transferase AbiEii/AbiGii toxin family protein [Flavobacterium dauae]WLD24336.1 nucleotidyl transferase AbiEii/AbiGii toxin family protein [Flavobacterium dauae]